MFENAKAEMLFATPVARYSVEDSAQLNAELLAEGHRMRSLSDGVNKSNQGGWHSEGNIFKEDAACFARLREAAMRAAVNITKSAGSKADMASLDIGISGWMNINGRGAYNAPHTHPGNLWSGVYYVSQPETEDGRSGMIEFLDPRSDLPNWRILKIDTFRPKRRIRPSAGEILMFPSYLTHWVYPNETDEERVSIAFNVNVKNKRKSKK